jgi:hypothetical protein
MASIYSTSFPYQTNDRTHFLLFWAVLSLTKGEEFLGEKRKEKERELYVLKDDNLSLCCKCLLSSATHL